MPNLTLNTTPDTIALAGNGLKYEIESSNFVTSAGTKAKWTILLAGDGPYDDCEIHLSCDLFNIELSFVDSPDESGLEMPQCSLPYNQLAYRDILIAALKTNYYLAKYCDVYALDANASIYIRFKEVGDLNISHSTYYLDDVTITDHEGTDAATQSNYRVGALVMVDDIVIAEEVHIPDSDNKVFLDIAEYIKPLCEADFTFPAGDDLIIERSNAIVEYLLAYFEKYGTTPAPKIINYDNARIALPGGVGFMFKDKLLANTTDWITEHTEDLKFLTWAPNNALVATTDSIRLFWLSQDDKVAVSLVAKYATSEILYNTWVSKEILSLSENKVYEIICDPSKLFTELQLETMESFTVALMDATDAIITETRTFYIDTNMYPRRQQLMAANSFGIAFDMFVSLGKSVYEIELDNYISMTWGDTSQTQSRSKRADRYSFNTGPLSYANIHHWQEFLISEKRYIVTDQLRIPLRIVSTKFFMWKDREYMYALQIECEIYTPDKYINQIPTSAFSDSFNTGSGIPVISSGGGGHIIMNAAGDEFTQRSYLKFTGDGVTVTDDEENDATIINIPGSTGGGEGASLWNTIALDNITLTPAGAGSILTTADLRDSFIIGDFLKVKQDDTWRYCFIYGATTSTITVKGEALDTGEEIQEIKIGKQPLVGGWYIAGTIAVPGEFADADESTMIANDLLASLSPGGIYKIIAIRGRAQEVDSGTPDVAEGLNVSVNSNTLFTSYVRLTTANTWYYSGADADSSNNECSLADIIEIMVQAASGALAAKDGVNLTTQLLLVKPDLE